MRGGSSRHEYAVLDRGSACLQCKRRKKRCDGTKPICGPCVRFGTADQCEFPRPPTPKPKTKPSPPRSKSEALRMQIRDLEEQLSTLQQAVSATQASGSHQSSSIPNTGDSASSGHHLVPHNHYEYDDDRDTDDMDEDVAGQRSRNRFSQHDTSPRSHQPHFAPRTSSTPERELSGLTDELLHIFLRHRRRCAFEIDEHRFALKFRHSTSPSNPVEPTSSPDAFMHPCLITAVLLVGCHFAAPSGAYASISETLSTHLERLEPYLLEQTKTNLQQSLTGADRLGDFLQGSALIVWYLFRKGKSAEGAFHAAGLSCFATACRLHLLSNASLSNFVHPSPTSSNSSNHPLPMPSTSSNHLHHAPTPPPRPASASLAVPAPGYHHGASVTISLQNQPTQIIPPAKTIVELEERICLFWSIFVLDRYASLVFPSRAIELTKGKDVDVSAEGTMGTGIQDEMVWTRWPRDAGDWESVRPEDYLPAQYSHPRRETSFPSLDDTPDSTTGSGGPVIPKSNLSFRATSAMLLDRSAKLALASSEQVSSSSLHFSIQRQYDMPHIQRSFDSVSATAKKIAKWLSSTPTSLLLLSNSRHQHSRHPSQRQSSFQGSQSNPPTPLYHQHAHSSHTSSLPSSPLHHQHHMYQPPALPSSSPLGMDFGRSGSGSTESSILENPSEAASLLLAHSSLDVTWIRLNAVARALGIGMKKTTISSSAATGGGNEQFYRPGAGAAGVGRHTPVQPIPLANSVPVSTYPQYPTQGHRASHLQHHQQHSPQSQPQQQQPQSIHAYSPQNTASPEQSQVWSQPWTGEANDSAGLAFMPPAVGAEGMGLGLGLGGTPQWIQGPPDVMGSNQSSMQHQFSHQHMQPPQPVTYHGAGSHSAPHQHQASHPTPRGPHHPQTLVTLDKEGSDAVIAVDGVGKTSMEASKEIADLANLALGLPRVFDELDMMVGVAWTVALKVVTAEIQRFENLGYTQESPVAPLYRHSSSSSFSTSSQPTTPATLGSFSEQQQLPSSDMELVSQLRERKEILLHALDRLKVTGSGVCESPPPCSSIPAPSSQPLPPPPPPPSMLSMPLRGRPSPSVSLSSSSRYSPYRRTQSNSSFTTSTNTTAKSTPLLENDYQLGGVGTGVGMVTGGPLLPPWTMTPRSEADYQRDPSSFGLASYDYRPEESLKGSGRSHEELGPQWLVEASLNQQQDATIGLCW